MVYSMDIFYFENSYHQQHTFKKSNSRYSRRRRRTISRLIMFVRSNRRRRGFRNIILQNIFKVKNIIHICTHGAFEHIYYGFIDRLRWFQLSTCILIFGKILFFFKYKSIRFFNYFLHLKYIFEINTKYFVDFTSDLVEDYWP